MVKIVVTINRGMKLWAKFALFTVCTLLLSAFMFEPAFALNLSIMHNSSSTSNKYGSWGLDKDCYWCHSTTKTTNVKKILETVNTPSGPRKVVFYRMTAVFNNQTGVLGNDSRLYAATASTNICEVCHHQTSHHQYSSQKVTAGHYDNQQCTTCHLHADGFKPTGHSVPYYADSGVGHPTCETATGCHANINPAAPYPTTGSTPPDCRSCHAKADPTDVGSGCGSCHGAVAANSTGEPSGSVYPDVAGSHAVHTAISDVTCSDCHVPGGAGGKTDHGKGNRGANAAIVNVNASFGWASASSTCASASCHSNVYGDGYVTTPAWGSTGSSCRACHAAPYAFQANGAPPTGSHNKHMGITGVVCDQCHVGAVKNVTGGASHSDGVINVNASLLYNYTAGGTVIDYSTRPKHAPGTPGIMPDYGTCSASCHSSPYSEGYVVSPIWGATSGCASCHKDDGAFDTVTLGGAPNTGSHDRHMNQGATCGQCHTGAVSGVSGGDSHPNGVVNVAGGYTASPVAKHAIGSYAGYCTNASCHNDGRGGAETTPVWGVTNDDCTTCHGGDATSIKPIATLKHRSHINNYSTLGSNNNLKCAECHALTVSIGSNRLVTTTANHFNGVKNFSGAKAGGSVNYNLASKVCSNVYCHSSGQAVPVYRNMTGALAWDGAAKLDCSGCHGSSTNATWATPLGAPNYRNNSTTTANSHQRHVAAMITDTTGCSRCHNSTVSSTVSNRLKDNNQAHINRSRDVNFALFGVYSASTKSCTTYCHSNVQSPGGSGSATVYAKPQWGNNGAQSCGSCHADMSTLVESADNLKLGSHRRHAVYDNTTAGTSGAGYSCSLCHGTGYDVTATNDALHANQIINVKFTGKAAGNIYSQYSGNVPGNGYGTCSNSRCHGRAVRSWGATGNTTNPTCEKCHGSARTAQVNGTFFDTTINSQQYAGAHVRHLAPLTSNPISCNACHTVPTSIASFGHMSSVNGIVNAKVTFKGLALHSSLQTRQSMNPVFTPNPSLSLAVCSNTYCHAGFVTTALGANTTPAWGDSAYFGCGKCHGDPPGGTHPSVPQNQCNACHSHVDGTGLGFIDKSKHVDGIVETTADNCLICHAQEDSELCVSNGMGGFWFKDDHGQACFPQPLKGSHAQHTDVEYFLAGKKLSNGDYIDPNWIYTIKYIKGFPRFGCGFCHPMDVTKHKAGIVSVDLDPASSLLGTVKAKNAPAGVTPNGWYNTWLVSYTTFTKNGSGNFVPGTVVCNNVYCHSNGYISPATNKYSFVQTPDWYYSDKNSGASPWAGADRCIQCHGNSPNTDPNDGRGLRAGSAAHGRHVVANHYKDIFNGYSGKLPVAAASGARAHGDPASSTTFNCNICHFNTVRAAFNDKGTVCIGCHNGSTATYRGVMDLYSASTTHINGKPDVDFMAPFNVKSRAQLRDNLAAVQALYTSWSRVGGYKTYSSSHDLARQTPSYVGGSCSTVSCHNGTPMEWRTQGPLKCAACHTSLTN